MAGVFSSNYLCCCCSCCCYCYCYCYDTFRAPNQQPNTTLTTKASSRPTVSRGQLLPLATCSYVTNLFATSHQDTQPQQTNRTSNFFFLCFSLFACLFVGPSARLSASSEPQQSNLTSDCTNELRHSMSNKQVASNYSNASQKAKCNRRNLHRSHALGK